MSSNTEVSTEDEDYDIVEHGIVKVVMQQILRRLNKKAKKSGFTMQLITDDERVKYFICLKIAGKKEEFGPLTLAEGSQVIDSFEQAVKAQENQRGLS